MEVRHIDTLPIDIQAAIKHQSSHILCPICKGGKTGELSLQIFDDALKCWRASCGWYCKYFTGDVKFERKNLKEGKPYTGAAYHLSGRTEDFLEQKYGLRRPYIDRFREDDEGSLVIPIRGVNSELLGHITRTLGKPKRVMSYKETARPFIDVYPANSDTTVIVEDSLSALRIQQCGYNGVALLGTAMSVDKAREIANIQSTRYVLALDNDATDKAMTYSKRFAHIFKPLQVLVLNQDIKDMPTDESIRELIGKGADG